MTGPGLIQVSPSGVPRNEVSASFAQWQMYNAGMEAARQLASQPMLMMSPDMMLPHPNAQGHFRPQNPASLQQSLLTTGMLNITFVVFFFNYLYSAISKLSQ